MKIAKLTEADWRSFQRILANGVTWKLGKLLTLPEVLGTFLDALDITIFVLPCSPLSDARKESLSRVFFINLIIIVGGIFTMERGRYWPLWFIEKPQKKHILPERNKGNAHEMSKIHVESVYRYTSKIIS